MKGRLYFIAFIIFVSNHRRRHSFDWITVFQLYSLKRARRMVVLGQGDWLVLVPYTEDKTFHGNSFALAFGFIMNRRRTNYIRNKMCIYLQRKLIILFICFDKFLATNIKSDLGMFVLYIPLYVIHI